jgi:hypothetical protein
MLSAHGFIGNSYLAALIAATDLTDANSILTGACQKFVQRRTPKKALTNEKIGNGFEENSKF